MHASTSTPQQPASPRPLGPVGRFVIGTLSVILDALPARVSVKVLRSVFGSAKQTQNMGVHEVDLARAEAHPTVRIPVPGLPDAALTIYTPANPSEALRPLVLWIHGGGWIGGAASMLSSHSKVLAAQGFTVASLDYSLAPEECYPAPIVQAMAALAYLKEHAHRFGGDATRIVIGGDSAGAQLSSQLGALLTNPDFARRAGIAPAVPASSLRGLLLYCGVYNITTFVKCGFPATRTFLSAYMGRRDFLAAPRIAEMSTALHATADYPPAYIVCGDDDPLESESYQLDAILRRKGVPVQSRYWTGTGARLGHSFMYGLDSEAACTVLSETVQFIRNRTQR